MCPYMQRTTTPCSPPRARPQATAHRKVPLHTLVACPAVGLSVVSRLLAAACCLDNCLHCYCYCCCLLSATAATAVMPVRTLTYGVCIKIQPHGLQVFKKIGSSCVLRTMIRYTCVHALTPTLPAAAVDAHQTTGPALANQAVQPKHEH